MFPILLILFHRFSTCPKQLIGWCILDSSELFLTCCAQAGSQKPRVGEKCSASLLCVEPLLWCTNVQPKVCSGLFDQVDKLGLREHRASLYLQVNRLSDAEEAYRKLLDVNPDNYKLILSPK